MILFFRKEYFFDLHGSGTLAGCDDGLFLSHESLKGNPCRKKTHRIVSDVFLLDNNAA